MITEKQRLIILKALRDSYANLTAENMTEKEFDNLTNAMTIVKNCSIPDVVQQRELLEAFSKYINLKYDLAVGIDDYDIECFIEGLQ